jgi:hypothetical protein
MPWRCPACQIQIRHSDLEPVPRAGIIYRCHACRLELMVDLAANRLTVAPLPSAIADDRPAKTRKRKRS